MFTVLISLMIRLIFLLLILLLFPGNGKEAAFFPDKLNRINLSTASIDTVLAIFGTQCKIDTTYYQRGDKLIGCIYRSFPKTTRILMRYDSPNMEFCFQSEAPEKSIQLRTISISAGSPFNLPGLSKEAWECMPGEVKEAWGKPDQIYDREIWKAIIYQYMRKDSKRMYEFWFNKESKRLKGITISCLREAQLGKE